MEVSGVKKKKKKRQIPNKIYILYGAITELIRTGSKI